MTTTNIYLTFEGNCEEVFEFYKSVFGGEFSYKEKFGEMPPQEGMPQLKDDDKEKIMHICLPISKETMLMGSDTLPGFGPPMNNGNNFSISVLTDNKEEADRLFIALSKDGTIKMPLENTFWGAYYGMLNDKYGIQWMVSMDNSNQK